MDVLDDADPLPGAATEDAKGAAPVSGDWCRVEFRADTVQAQTALLAAWVSMTGMKLRAAGIWPPAVGEIEYRGFLLVGPDDLEDVVEFQTFTVIRVPHWPGRPCVGVPLVDDHGIPGAYALARRLQEAGVPAERLHLFGPPGVQYQALGLQGQGPRTVHGVPVDRMKRGLMIGVEQG